MQEMNTQQLKHLLSKNIGENIGGFSLPTMVTYLLQKQVEKRGVEVVDTSKKKTRYVYVVKVKTTTLSFVEVVDIKKYYDEYVILVTSKSSTTSDLNYID